MNKNLFRIIFNKRRGQLMVVAETSSSQGKGSRGEVITSADPTFADNATVALSALSFAVLCALGAVLWALPIPNAHAQVVAYRNAPSNQQPTILQTANGLPQINIQTPSAAGVSRNVYSQFDVQSNGVILNNSRTNAQTQQGGWVQGNPWLATGSARVILNEVNSSNPSQLNGYVEVAGQRAEVVIANPAGISVNGGGFINTSKATLTTGAPIVNGGSLDGYRVQGGNISINGHGLDLSATDYAAILARAVQVNAGIWANELKVVTGPNQIDAASLAANTTPVTTIITSTGAVPSFALDVAQIGGMYAGKIHLIGTEQGLGVRSAGTIGSTGGDLVLHANGLLTNYGSIFANGNLEVQALGLTNNQGSIASTANTQVTTTQDVVNNDGLITAGQTLTVQASHVTNTVNAEISGTQTQISASQTLTNRGLIDGISTQIVADSLTNIGTGRIYGDSLQINVNALRNDAETVAGVTTSGTIAARNTLTIQAANITNREHALIYSDGDMTMTVSDTLNNNSATLEAARDMVLNAKTIFNTNDHFSYEVRLDETQTVSQTDWLDYSVEHLYYRDYTRHVYVPFNTSSDPAQILAGRNMALNSDTVTNQDSHIILGGGLTYQGNNLVNADVTATKRIHDFGTNHVRVRTPDCDWTGNCNYNVFRWDTSGYDANQYSTVYAPQPVVYKNSGYLTTAVTPGSVSHNTLLPTSSMFKTNPSATSKYLVATDPRFANQKTWLGSAYITQYLSLDPTVTQKRLGDGFYEQKLIREQVANLTGRRYFGDYTSDQQQFQALMDSAITYAKAYNLRPGIALSDAQVAQLTSDIVWLVEQTVSLADGTSQKVLVPQVYVKPRTGDLQENGALISAKEIDIQLSGDLANSGTIAGRKVANLSADNIQNFNTLTGEAVSVAAQSDLNNVGGSINAVNSLSATAGRDLTIQTTTNSSSTDIGAGNFSRTTIDRVAGLYVSGVNGTLLASAGRDLVAQGAYINNAGSGDTALRARENFQLSSVTTRSSDRDVWSSDNYRKTQQNTEVGSNVSGGGKVQLQAGQALQVRASQIQATDTLSVEAHNVRIESGESQSSSDQAYKATSSGPLSSTTVASRDTSNSNTAVSSGLGGKEIKINADNDITVKGSNLVSNNATTLTAGGSVNIEAATNTSNSTSWRQTSSSGLSSNGGLSVSYGSKKQSTDEKDITTTAASSTVGSINGNVNITVGNQYKQVGSDVITPGGDIAITAKKVDIVEARETNKQSSEQKFEQSGLTLAVTSGLVSNLQGAQKQQQAASQTKDDRMKALAVANEVANVAAAAQNAMKVDVSLSYGISKSESKQTSTSDTARGSAVKAADNVNIAATGGDEKSNLTVQGSDISGQKISLAADNQVAFLAASNSSTQTSTSSNSSSSVGASIGTSGLGVTASAALGKGNGNGTDNTHTNTQIAGAESVTIKSGGDTTLKGATVEGKQVTATIGGKLTIESLQDTRTYTEVNKLVGGSVMMGVTQTGLASGNVNLAKSNIDSSYASVSEQSAIKAGNNGFAVNVQGDTELKGGAITSTQAAIDQNKNTFQTGGTLTTSDMQNSANYNANSLSVTVGTGSTFGQSASAGMSGVGFGTDKGSANSTTTAGISGIAGARPKRTGDEQEGIAQIFNKDQVKAEINAQTAITSEFGKNASKTVGDYAQTKLDEAKKNKDQTGIDAWSEGGSARVALHTVVGGLTGSVQGAVGAGTSQAGIDHIGEALRGADLPLEVKQALIAAAGTAMGAAASGGSVSGGATALNATANNYLYVYDGKIIARDKVDNNKVIVLSDKDKQKLAAKEPDVLIREIAGIDRDGAPILVKDERAKEMTDSTTYTLANSKDRAKLQERTDMGYINTDDKNTRIYVQTGMNTKPEDAIKNAQSLSKVVGEPVGVIVNGTQGLGNDVQEYLPKAPSIKDALNEYTYQTLNKQGDKLVVMHSAGNEDANKALQLGQQLGHQYSNLSFVSLGSPVSNSIMRQNVTQTQAQYLGQVNDWRDPVTNPTLWVTGTAALLAGGAAAGVALAPATGGTTLYAYGSALMGGGLGGGAIVYGINKIHPMENYIAKPQAQSIMFNWQAKAFRSDVGEIRR